MKPESSQKIRRALRWTCLGVCLVWSTVIAASAPPEEKEVALIERALEVFLVEDAGLLDVAVGMDEKKAVVAFRSGVKDRDLLIGQICAASLATGASAPWVEQIEIVFHAGGAPIGTITLPASTVRSAGTATGHLPNFVRAIEANLVMLPLGEPRNWLPGVCEVKPGWKVSSTEAESALDVFLHFEYTEEPDSVRLEDFAGAVVEVMADGASLEVGVMDVPLEEEKSDIEDYLEKLGFDGEILVRDSVLYLLLGPEEMREEFTSALDAPIADLALRSEQLPGSEIREGNGDDPGEMTKSRSSGTETGEGGDPQAVVELIAEFTRPEVPGREDETVQMVKELYDLDYRAAVARAAAEDRGELANLFSLRLDGVAAEGHAEVLYRLRKGLGSQRFDAELAKQSAVIRKGVSQLVDHHEENLGVSGEPTEPGRGMVEAKPATPSFFAAGNFETGISMEPGGGTVVQDPADPDNRVMAFTTEDYFEHALTVPPDVKGVRFSFRVWIPPTVSLETLEPGRAPPGVKIRLRVIDPQQNSELREWIVRPESGWQELSATIHDLGERRESFSLEASWFAGTIYIDDIEITSLYPAFLDEEMYEFYQTPAQVTYIYVVNPLFSREEVTRVGSPKITDQKVSVDFDYGGTRENLWFVEKSNDGTTASVVVGPPDAGGDLYQLRKIDGRWAITGIESGENL